MQTQLWQAQKAQMNRGTRLQWGSKCWKCQRSCHTWLVHWDGCSCR